MILTLISCRHRHHSYDNIVENDEITNESRKYIHDSGNASEISYAENDESSINIPDSESYLLPIILDNKSNHIIKHKYYVLSYNKAHNTPNWVAWQLTSNHVDGPIPRSKKFWADSLLSVENRVDWYEYKESGYDRGHMCPAGDNKWNKLAMYECFYMSNMCPQDPALNNGSWKILEESCRQWAVNEGKIYIVCGPIYRKNIKHKQIGIDHSIDVPEAFFKVVLSLRKGHEKAIGFLYSNDSKHQNYRDVAKSIDDIESLTNIDFFHELPDDLENKLESSFSISDW